MTPLSAAAVDNNQATPHERPADTAVAEKVARLAGGSPPRVVDLFSGCGGLSLGFRSAGFEIAAAIELDPLAALSHARNFHRDSTPSHFEVHATARDITAIDADELVANLGLGNTVDGCVDVLIGGPPCQSYARVGRAKLREIADHPDAFLQDPRRNLYLRYLHYVSKLRPLVVLMENVPDVINQAGHNVPEEMSEVLSEWGYDVRYTLLNAAFYGVPQMRERMFLLAYARELGSEVSFPSPSHWIVLPRGYEGSRQVALKSLSSPFSYPSCYMSPPSGGPDLPPAITARQALNDLPKITDHLNGRLRRGARRFTDRVAYRTDVEPSPYARALRSWPGWESDGGVCDHVIRSLPRDYALFRAMAPGDQYPQAHRRAMEMFEAELSRLEGSGHRPADGTIEFERVKASIVPPYDAGKFPNKWRKMESDRPARTLMAHLGKDGYSHIHFDAEQARTISVREAARLQSFPDGFAFAGTMNPAFRQIGNAVPPVLARAIAIHIMNHLPVQKDQDMHLKGAVSSDRRTVVETTT